MILHEVISRRDDAAVLVKSRLQRTTATPSSRHRVDGVEVNAMNQHEGAVNLSFTQVSTPRIASVAAAAIVACKWRGQWCVAASHLLRPLAERFFNMLSASVGGA